LAAKRDGAIRAIRTFADSLKAHLRRMEDLLPELYGEEAIVAARERHLEEKGKPWDRSEAAANTQRDVDELVEQILHRVNRCLPASPTENLSDLEVAALFDRQHISAEDLRLELNTSAESLRVARHRAKEKVADKIPKTFKWRTAPGRALPVTRATRTRPARKR
jgi:hypothetical protein